jgi:hypothetical protein
VAFVRRGRPKKADASALNQFVRVNIDQKPSALIVLSIMLL